ncbi:MAG: hypothetical protein ABSG03_31185 [Bryobacteraceae bacterium]|jgi:hypothetical protein
MRLIEWWRVRRLFDAEFYLERYPDVRQARMNPLRHYLLHGAAEGRKPHRLFDPDYYLSNCPEARNSANPLLHFIETGGRLGNPHPLFDCNTYLAAHPDAARRGVNPLLHYIKQKKAARGSDRSHDREGVVSSGDESATRGSRADEGVRPTRLEILDVTVEIAFWEDSDGRMSFIAEPQQQAFFRAMRFDQLSAQVNR